MDVLPIVCRCTSAVCREEAELLFDAYCNVLMRFIFRGKVLVIGIAQCCCGLTMCKEGACCNDLSVLRSHSIAGAEPCESDSVEIIYNN
jgi:hypothetical protein